MTLREARGGAAPRAAAAGAAPRAGCGTGSCAAPAAAGCAAVVDVLVPDMGNFTEVGVIDVLVKPGDTVEVDTPLVTLETEKATMDVPSTAAGVVEKVHVAEGRQDFRGRPRRDARPASSRAAASGRTGGRRRPRRRLHAAAAPRRGARAAPRARRRARRSTRPASARPMRARRCASWRANSVWTCRA